MARIVCSSLAAAGEKRGLRRRELLVGGVAGGAALVAPINYVALARQRATPLARDGRFAHGVAAGFPSPRAITLWTRVSELERTSRVSLEVATDKRFHRLVERRHVRAEAGPDFTVHDRVAGLEPGREYFYRFATKDRDSRVGRFRTLPPPDSKQPVRIGFYSCQNYQAGYFNAQAALAREPDLDLVICLGDYIYERGSHRGGPADRIDTTGVNGDGNVQTLAEYRQKYRLYQTDRGLQKLQASYPMVSVWDDHEVENNYAGDTADSSQPDPSLENNGDPRRVPFGERRANGYRAFFEAMPRIQSRRDPNAIYGSLGLGSIAELFLTDQRQYRDPQPCKDAQLVACPENELPGRTMLGAEQKSWFKRAVAGSRARWKLWGSEVMVMSLDLPAGQAASQDQWDGYAAERREILEHFVGAGVSNLTALTGDIHTFIAGDVTTTGRRGGTPVGVELVGGSATSLGLPETLGVPSSQILPLVPDNDPHIRYAELDRRGYCVLTASKHELRAEFKAVDALTPGSRAVPLASFQVLSGDPSLRQL